MDKRAADDATQIAAARAGDLDAFETLVRRHTPAVYSHALRFFGESTAAEDVVQEVFIKVFRSLGSFDNRSQFSTWLYQVTRNTCLDQVRAGRRRPVPVDPFLMSATDPIDIADSVAVSASVEHALASLPNDDRDALLAVALFGLTYDEAARVFEIPAGTVKSRVFRARRTIALSLNIADGGLS
ncbi:MAG TPA: RNA polymerase sigma factor [Coriobacteriia bacterium]|nr:RNA polymerase sigma factor [Coriobacteriia bacterium]